MYRWIVTIAVVLTALAAGAWKAHHSGIVKGRAEVQADWDRAKLQAIEKRELNRDTARKVEIRYVDREIVRTEYLTATKEEMRHETANLESCRLDAGDIGLLNKAASTARQD
jgi:hypothetical protein